VGDGYDAALLESARKGSEKEIRGSPREHETRSRGGYEVLREGADTRCSGKHKGRDRANARVTPRKMRFKTTEFEDAWVEALIREIESWVSMGRE
jgi:hypothetical protein